MRNKDMLDCALERIRDSLEDFGTDDVQLEKRDIALGLLDLIQAGNLKLLHIDDVANELLRTITIQPNLTES